MTRTFSLWIEGTPFWMFSMPSILIKFLLFYFDFTFGLLMLLLLLPPSTFCYYYYLAFFERAACCACIFASSKDDFRLNYSAAIALS